MSFQEIRRVKVGEVEIAYREEGDGEPLLLVHGWPLSSLTWRKVVPGLAGRFRCIALDLLGAGASDKPASRSLSLPSQSAILGGFADALGLERFALAGHDSGGSVARGLAVESPERISRLVLADTEVPGHRPPFVVALSWIARLPGAGAIFSALFASQGLSRSPAGFGLCFGDLKRFDFAEFFETVVAPNGSSAESVRASRRFLLDFDFAQIDELQPRYDGLRMPKTVIWGEKDRFFPLAQGSRLVEMLPEPTRYVTVPGAGLFVHEEQPEAWVKAVLES